MIEENNNSITTQIDAMIQQNNVSTTSEETTTRFKGAPWYEEIQKYSILIAGIGGIGSWTALLISRMRPKNLLLMDNDSVEIGNLSGQLYSIKDVDISKVDALSNTIRDYSMYNNTMAIKEPFTQDSEPYDIMICGFDNMDARKLYFKKWLQRVKSKSKDERSNCLFIDGRLNAEKFQVFSITGDNYYAMNKYASEYLFDDADVPNLICSYKQTSYCAAMIGSFICNILVNFACHNYDERPVLFFQEFDAETISLKQEQ